jgi:alkanesulfonate monooxygenase
VADIRIYSTCPQSKDWPPEEYRDRVMAIAGWSDETGCDGMLIYADNSIVDPWTVVQIVLQSTLRIAPLVAVQPIYMHPYAVAKNVVSLALLYKRQICLNMIAGGFRGDLTALGDGTPHDDRYVRLKEYTHIIQQLLTSNPVTHCGQYYKVHNLRLNPPLLAPLPEILISGSSSAGRKVAVELGLTAVEYPQPADQITDDPDTLPPNRGIRVGIIADHEHSRAWRLAWERFPPDRLGQLQHALAVRVSDSKWHHTLETLAQAGSDDSPYWLWPYKNYKTFCPYLVGDYDTVTAEIVRYLRMGYTTFILDIPRAASDLEMAHEVFRRAKGAIRSQDHSPRTRQGHPTSDQANCGAVG